MENNIISLKSYLEFDELLDLVLGNIEDSENTQAIFEITRWLMVELEAYGSDSSDYYIKKSREVLLQYLGNNQ